MIFPFALPGKDGSILQKTMMIWRAIILLKFPKNRLWIDYDEEADVLYLSFQRPQKATESEMRDDGVLLRYKRDKLVGITILEASKR
jgi:uncharacterized protein YuzE